MIILGIDPGTATTGYGVIEQKNKKIECIDYGCIETSPVLSDSKRLNVINKELKKIIKTFQPKVMAVENVFFFKNLKTAFPVSQAKGVILLTAAQKKISVYEYTPLQIKMAVTGYGKAHKKQVQSMTQVLFKLKEKPKPDDAADALAVAFCHTAARGIMNQESRIEN